MMYKWYYSADTKKSVDMVLVANGIPVFAFELKNQYTGQNVDNAKTQWMYDRDPREDFSVFLCIPYRSLDDNETGRRRHLFFTLQSRI